MIDQFLYFLSLIIVIVALVMLAEKIKVAYPVVLFYFILATAPL